MKLSEKIIGLRKSKGLSQEDLAEKLYMRATHIIGI